MEIAEEEIDIAVNEAFAEGYKSAMLQYGPSAQAYKQLAENFQTDLIAQQKKNRFLWPAVGVSAGVSFAVGVLFSLLLTGR